MLENSNNWIENIKAVANNLEQSADIHKAALHLLSAELVREAIALFLNVKKKNELI